MNMTTAKCPYQTKAGTPVWELARVFPGQGYWTEEEYLELDRTGNMLVELTDGYVEVLPMPTWEHQKIVLWFAGALLAFIGPRKLGEAVCAPVPTRLRKNKWREPDIIFVLKEHVPQGGYPDHADLAVEVVSEDAKSRQRDYRDKRKDYAVHGVSEYWIVDPQAEQITVLTLKAGRYVERGVFKKGTMASSALLKGFEVSVDAVFAAAK
ncbi:MAG: Uma2 family endonuclease [Planctomycetota bacterium]|nr:Uma2 family endonuclease [Planctomycetota bacterium]